MKKLLSIILLVAGALLPMKLWAQDKVYEPYFQFEGDNLLMHCDTEGATIYYVIEPYSADMSEDEAYTFAESLQVNDQSAVYSNPIPITENVIIKVVAVKQGMASSDPSTLIYNYLAWKDLEKAILYGSDVLSRAQDNPNVDQSLKEDLQWRIEEGEHFYYERAWMDSHQAEHFSQEIMDIARQIEEQMGGGTTTAEPYAVLSDNNTVLTFYYDEHKAERNGMSVGPFQQDASETREWHEQRESIQTVIFNDSFANYTGMTSTAHLFTGCSNLETINGIGNLKTDNVTTMYYMFSGCSKLTTIDVSGFKTGNVRNMWGLFWGCSSLTNVDLSNFDTRNVTSIGGMFESCSSLTSVDVSGFNTDYIRSMIELFDGCSSLTSVKLFEIKESSNTGQFGFFAMFRGCSSLTSIDLSRFNTTNVTYMNCMFNNCSALTSLDLSGFNTSNVTDMGYMFNGCSNLETIYVGNEWSTASVTNGEEIFDGCTNLVGGRGTTYSADHTDAAYAHIDGGKDNPGYFTRSGDEPWVEPAGNPEPYAVLSDNNTVLTFYYDQNRDAYRESMEITPEFAGTAWMDYREQIEKVVFDPSFAACNTFTRTNSWFTECRSLTSIEGIKYLNTDNVIDMAAMFLGCHSLTNLDVSHFNTANVTDMGWMFSACTSLTSLNISNFNTENVTSMASMFGGCEELTTIFVGNGWNTSKVGDSENMFYGCNKLIGGNGTRFDESHTDVTYARIDMEGTPGYLTGADNSLVAYFPFNGNANDESGHGNNGTPTEAVTLTTGVQGDANGAYQFGSVENSGHIHMPNSESLQIGDEWSFATYVKPLSSAGMDEWGSASDNGTHAIVGHSHDRTGFAIQYGINEERFHTYIGHWDGGWNDGVSASADGNYLNKWIHIAYTYANNTFRIYINGKLITTTYTTPDFTDANTQDWYFGKYSDYWYPLNGILDEIRIYNRALRDDEVEDLAKYADKLEESGATFDGLTAWVSGDVPLEEAFMEVEGGREAAVQTIAAIVWENSYALTADMLQGISNPNLLVYVNEPSLAPQGIQNVVVNGQAQEIVLTDAATGNNNWYCPQAFTAERIRYTRNFGQQTEVGVSRGWESIALPFTVQEITHESKGQITPFGANGTKHFWLRGYSPDGLYSAVTLEANKPYVISMPNNTVVYPDAYNLNGRVTFSASNTTVPATPPSEEMMVVRDNIIMMPTFQYIPQNEYIYAVNVGQARERYAEGSVFARDLRDVRPFEAYTTHGERNGARPNFIRIAAQPNNETVGIKDNLQFDNLHFDNWYSIDGRQIQGEPQRKGVYIQKGKKVVR